MTKSRNQIILKIPSIKNILTRLIERLESTDNNSSKDSGEKEPNLSCKLMFVEYNPDTRAFYDYVGVSNNTLKSIKKVISYDNILDKMIDIVVSLIINKDRLQKNKKTNKIDYDNEQDLFEKINSIVRNDLKNLKVYYEGKKHAIVKTINKLLNNNTNIRLNEILELSQYIPQPRGAGDSDRMFKKKSNEKYKWDLVPNSNNDIGDYLTLALFETFFKIRTNWTYRPGNEQYEFEDMVHKRQDVILETGERVGQIIGFTKKSNGQKELLESNMDIATKKIKKMIQTIRQSRYLDSVLQGGNWNPNYILLANISKLIPLKTYYIRIDQTHNMKDDTIKISNIWKDFFNDKEEYTKIYQHKICNSVNSLKNGSEISLSNHFVNRFLKGSNKFENKIGSLSRTINDEIYKDGLFFVDVDKDREGEYKNIILGLSKRSNSYISFLGIIDIKKGHLKEKGMLNDKNELSKTFELNIYSILFTILNPGDELKNKIIKNRRGKSYRDRYGMVLYEENYLNIKDNNKEKLIIDKYYQSIKKMYDKFNNSLWEPYGFEEIARTIYEDFFKNTLDKLLLGYEFKNNISMGDLAIFNLIKNALDFESTLSLSDTSYREHFIHSYHVFLLGIYFSKKIKPIKNKFRDERNILKWFLASMYHDIGYPIEKIENISKSYLIKILGKKGDTNINIKDGNEIECNLNADWSSIIRNEDFINDFYHLIDLFFNRFIFLNDKIRNKKITDSDIISISSDVDKKYSKNQLKKEFIRGSYNALTKNADHGIFSALLLLHSMKKDIKKVKINKYGINKFEDLIDEVASAIFSHHMLDGTIKRGEKWNINGQNKLYEGFKFDHYSFNITDKHETPNNWLSSLLILSDCCAQWGRKNKDSKQQKIALHPELKRSTDIISLCYPELEKDKGEKDKNKKKLDEMKKFYEEQCSIITVECNSDYCLRLNSSNNCDKGDFKSNCSMCKICKLNKYKPSIDIRKA